MDSLLLFQGRNQQEAPTNNVKIRNVEIEVEIGRKGKTEMKIKFTIKLKIEIRLDLKEKEKLIFNQRLHNTIIIGRNK